LPDGAEQDAVISDHLSPPEVRYRYVGRKT
jgi:hypothetical protein